MDTAMKTFISSPTANSLLSFKRPDLLDIVDELCIMTVKLYYTKDVTFWVTFLGEFLGDFFKVTFLVTFSSDFLE